MLDKHTHTLSVSDAVRSKQPHRWPKEPIKKSLFRAKPAVADNG